MVVYNCIKKLCGNAQFLHGCLNVSYRSWDKSTNPCSCTNRTFPNSVHHQILESTQPAALCVTGLVMHLIGKCVISARAWVLAILQYCCKQNLSSSVGTILTDPSICKTNVSDVKCTTDCI